MALDIDAETGDAVAPIAFLFRRYAAQLGQFAGAAATFAALPTTRQDSSPLVIDDYARLDTDDGPNVAGLYTWTGAAWVYSEPIPTAPAIEEASLSIRNDGGAVPIGDGRGGLLLSPDGVIERYDAGDLVEVDGTLDGLGLYWAIVTDPIPATEDTSAADPPRSLEPEGMFYRFSVRYRFRGVITDQQVDIEFDADGDYDSSKLTGSGAIPAGLLLVDGIPAAAQTLFDARLEAAGVGLLVQMGARAGRTIFVQLLGDPAPSTQIPGDVRLRQTA